MHLFRNTVGFCCCSCCFYQEVVLFLCYFFFSPRVLMGDVQGLIEKQTLNDTVNPRSSSSYYENYHSMTEVRYCHCVIPVDSFRGCNLSHG